MNRFLKSLFCMASFVLAWTASEACTNILVTRGASRDGSVLVSYSADSHTTYGELYHTPAGFFPKGSRLAVFAWETGKRMGEIEQIAQTYSTVGNMNEHQLIITETTFGGKESLIDTTGIMDYGALIYITLQRAKTAREAIGVMTSLVKEYGYASSGETFSIADKNEVWIMEMVGKGTRLNKKGENLDKGAVWVALRVPEGFICAHANQSRITTFPLDDPENCLYAEDIFDFARANGYYEGPDSLFSFCDAFAVNDFFELRACEARVWAAYNLLGNGKIGNKPASEYLDYASGHNPSNRMPLFIQPDHKLSLKEVADAMRDHFEGTPFDMTQDIGAGGFESPYRWRPMTFDVDGKTYINERAIATQQTGFWMVGQARNWLPDEIGGIIWFGVDDAATSCLTPIYTSTLRIPECLKEGNGNLITYSPTAAFWIFSRVAKQAYLQYNLLAPEIRKEADEHENGALRIIPEIDKEALNLMETHPDQVRERLTAWSEKFADRMFRKWQKLDEYLLIKYLDGNRKVQNPDGSFKENGYGKGIPADPEHPEYSETWKKAVARETGDKLIVPPAGEETVRTTEDAKENETGIQAQKETSVEIIETENNAPER